MDQAVHPAAPAPASRRVWGFPGGLHLPDHKRESTGGPLRPATLPARLWLPLQQHIGEPAQPVVSDGDLVLKGQLLARPKGAISAGVHAPTSGTVASIGPHPIPHPSGLTATCIELATDGRDAWAELPEPWPDFEARDPAELRERVRWAGIVGLGGAAFPSSVKLSPRREQPIHTLILNGAECEPYITCDDVLM